MCEDLIVDDGRVHEHVHVLDGYRCHLDKSFGHRINGSLVRARTHRVGVEDAERKLPDRTFRGRCMTFVKPGGDDVT